MSPLYCYMRCFDFSCLILLLAQYSCALWQWFYYFYILCDQGHGGKLRDRNGDEEGKDFTAKIWWYLRLCHIPLSLALSDLTLTSAQCCALDQNFIYTDGYDETLIPVDYIDEGQIRDDDLFQVGVCVTVELRTALVSWQSMNVFVSPYVFLICIVPASDPDPSHEGRCDADMSDGLLP